MARFPAIFVIFTTLISWAWSETRILNGKNADIENFPYQISLRYRRYHVCGGSIYKPKVIITAAHCVRGLSPKYFTILAGSADVNGADDDAVFREIRKIIRHPNYSSEGFSNDIALLILRGKLEFGTTIQPIGLPPPNSIQGRQEAVASGWGVWDRKLNSPRRLQFLRMVAFNNVECKKICRKQSIAGVLDETMICGGNLDEESGCCSGDSGGPLAVNNTLIGLVSFGSDYCAKKGHPTVFTNVAHMTAWIEEVSAQWSE